MKLILLLGFIIALSACGIKGKPLPPLPEEPLSAPNEKIDSVSSTTTVQPLKTLPVKKKKNK